MSHIEQIRDYFKGLKEGSSDSSSDKTHLMEIYTLMRSGLDDLALSIDLAYGENSLVGRIKFADGKTYEIEVYEVRGGSK